MYENHDDYEPTDEEWEEIESMIQEEEEAYDGKARRPLLCEEDIEELENLIFWCERNGMRW